MKETIEKYLSTFDFDIKKSNKPRSFDQKVTPDVLTIIADCITEFVEKTGKEEFTIKDIWEFEYSSNTILDIFNKPNTANSSAKSEYNKFFGQPLLALAYSKILSGEKRTNKWYFKIKNKKILDYIAIRERNSLLFLHIYLEKILYDSSIGGIFKDFFKQQSKNSFNNLKLTYVDFIIKNTEINNKDEARRIFTKVLNPLAFKYKKFGTRGGRISKTPITLDELYYNRANWRDVSKSKNETRDEYVLRAQNKIITYKKYSLQKAKKLIRKYHSPNSEIKDEFSNGEATQIHHIFMKSDFISIDSYLENLILLTATQHYTKAHPNNNTNIINEEYQKVCLLAKINSINKFPELYSKDDFLHVLKIGLNEELFNNIEFGELKEKLVELYNVA